MIIGEAQDTRYKKCPGHPFGARYRQAPNPALIFGSKIWLGKSKFQSLNVNSITKAQSSKTSGPASAS